MRGQIEIVQSCDEKRGRKLHEKRSTDAAVEDRVEAMERHDTARHEVSPIKERTYW